MKTSNLWSTVAILGLCLSAAGVHAQSARDTEVLVPLARAVVAEPAPEYALTESEVIEDLPPVVATRWSAEDDALATHGAMGTVYWLGLFSLCAGAAGALTLRRRARDPQAHLSLPPTVEGRISLV